MSLHLVKLCVGAASIEDLADWQTARLKQNKPLAHTTFQSPKRQPELLDGGSLYWVIKGLIQVRQCIIGFGEGAKEDGSACCLIMLDPQLIPVRPVPRRAFQGWRYLSVDDAPSDMKSGLGEGIAEMPAAMRKSLAELALL